MSIDQVVTSVINQSDPKPSILVADDSRVVRVSLKNILQKDYNIIEAEDGTEAWRILLNGSNIKLILSDLSMPNLDGIGLLRKLRQSDDERIRNTPFIVITGNEEDQEMRAQLLSEGANELISKPFEPSIITQQAKKHTGYQTVPTVSATTDSWQFLRGILSQSQFTQDVRKELSFAIRNKNELALLLLKLDQFETLKKHYSDPAIEQILITTAEIIRTHSRIEDKAAYFGEGVFAILLPASNVITTRYLGKRVLSDLVAKRFYLGESGTTVTASIGVSAPEIKLGTTFNEILGLAQQRLQAAINAGGNRVVEKGTATITPVTTLISDNPEEDPLLHRKLFRQTEQEMRELALQEVKRSNLEHSQNTIRDPASLDPKGLNDELHLIKQENKLLKDELVQLRQESAKHTELKKQLHETDSLQQQTQFRLQQLRDEFEAMRIRAEEAESDQSRLEESESDRSIIEEHLLQDSQQLDKELREANQRIEQTLAAFHRAEQVIASLKEQLKSQKEDFNLELAEEHVLRSMAEQKLAELQIKQQTKKQETNPFSLTTIPTIAPIEKPVESRNVYQLHDKQKQPVRPKPVAVKPVKTVTRTTLQHSPEKPKTSKLLLFFALLAVGFSGYLFWQTNGAAYETRSKNINHAAALTEQPAVTEQAIDKTDDHAENNSVGQAKKKLSVSSKDITPSSLSVVRPAKSQEMEEAILQAELIIRQTAEEEFEMLLRK